MKEISNEILSDITVFMKYSKYIPELQRRETWDELVTRNKEMHVRKFPQLKEEIEHAYDFVLNKKILPSMRSMQFAGKPIEISPNRVYNCAYMPIDDWRAFGEAMFLFLLHDFLGLGIGCHEFLYYLKIQMRLVESPFVASTERKFVRRLNL